MQVALPEGPHKRAVLDEHLWEEGVAESARIGFLKLSLQC